jgi:predicted nucleotidyltransferase
MNAIRYPYIGNPLGFKLPDPKPVVHPIIYKWDDLPEDQKEELETIKKVVYSIIGQCDISLFGSIVKGYWDEESDYDLLVHKQVSKELISELRKQTYPRKVDLNISSKNFVSNPGHNVLI